MCQTSAPFLRGQWGVKCLSESGDDDLQRRNSKEGRERSTGSTDMRHVVFCFFFCLPSQFKQAIQKQANRDPRFPSDLNLFHTRVWMTHFHPSLNETGDPQLYNGLACISRALQSNSVNSLSPTPSAWEDRKPIWIAAPKAWVSPLLNYLHTLIV